MPHYLWSVKNCQQFLAKILQLFEKKGLINVPQQFLIKYHKMKYNSNN